MAKLTLSDVSNLLGNPTSAQNTINNNSTLIEQALENTLSRDGRTPNQMGADLDMNNNDILNVGIVDTERLFLDGEEFKGLDPEDLEIIRDVSDAIKDGTLSNVVSQGNVPIYATVIGMPSVSVPSAINAIRVNGYYTVGDGGGALYIKVNDEPVHAGKFQTMDGAWWEIAKGPISSKTFGARMDGSDDAAAVNNALQFSAAKGLPVKDGSGTLSAGQTIVFPNGARWEGNNYQTFVKRLTGHTGALLKTENFDALTGTNDAFAAGVPERISVTGITFDGNYQNPARTAYVQAAGEGLRVYARKISLHVRVFNTPGVGIWVECPGGNGPTPLQPGFSREADICLYTHQTQYEGVVWKGPPDVKIGWILQADAGSRLVADQLNGKVSSPNYGAVNGGKTDGVVFDGRGAEITAIHCFGNFAGGGFDWRNGGRINADLIMVESCYFGGASIAGAAQGMISKFDIHRTGGFSGDATADFIYKGVGGNNYGLEIGTLASYRQDAANLGSRNNVEISGNFLNIGNVKIDNGSTATAGHGIFIDMDNAAWVTIGGGEIARCKGTAPDGLASSAVYRKGTETGSMLSIKANVRDCDVVFRSDGAPYVEEVDLQYYLNAGQLPFVGTVRTNITQEWNIRGRLGATRKVSHFEGAPNEAIFDPTLTTKQTLTIPHNLIHAPGFGRYQVTGILDTPSSMTAGRVGFVQVVGADDTNITVEVQMATANGSNTAPRVTIQAEL